MRGAPDPKESSDIFETIRSRRRVEAKHAESGETGDSQSSLRAGFSALDSETQRQSAERLGGLALIYSIGYFLANGIDVASNLTGTAGGLVQGTVTDVRRFEKAIETVNAPKPAVKNLPVGSVLLTGSFAA